MRSQKKVNIEEPIKESKGKQKIYTCAICVTKKFKTTKGLFYHISSTHEGKKLFGCNICNATFTTNQCLNGHINTVHEGKKPFNCNVCDASFAQKFN